MNYRSTVLLAEEAADTATTKTIDINNVEPISRISVLFRGQNSSDTPLAHPAKMVTTIKLINGADVLMSLSGYQARALDFYTNRQPVPEKMMYVDDDWTRLTFNLNFGRYLYDPRYAFVPTKYKNPQLQITHNKALGGSTCDHGYLQVYADCFDEKAVSPEGFLMAKEHYSYSLGNNTYETIDMPVDRPYRLIMPRALEATYAIWEQFDEIKFSSDQDKHVIIDGTTRELLKLFDAQFGPYTETLQGRVGTGTTGHYLTPSSECNVMVVSYGGNRDYYQSYQPFGGYVEVAASAALTRFQGLAHGFAPHGAICIPMGDLNDPNDWFDVSQVKSLKLRLHATSGYTGAATADVVIQQVRTD